MGACTPEKAGFTGQSAVPFPGTVLCHRGNLFWPALSVWGLHFFLRIVSFLCLPKLWCMHNFYCCLVDCLEIVFHLMQICKLLCVIGVHSWRDINCSYLTQVMYEHIFLSSLKGKEKAVKNWNQIVVIYLFIGTVVPLV